jgi:L-lactate dehydrogenase
MTVALRARVRELVLIDKDRMRARGAVATTCIMRCPLCRLVTIGDDDYDDLDGAGLVILAAGVNEKAGAPPTGAIGLAGFVLSRPT